MGKGVDGQLQVWNGPLAQVQSPVQLGEKRVHIGSTPLLDADTALTALDAAVRAYDRGQGLWPTMRVAERIQVTDQEVQNFLASDLGKMQLSEEFRLANILIPVSEGASSSEIQAADRQAQELYQQLQQGADLKLAILAGAALLSATVLLATGWPLVAIPLAVCALFFAAKAVLS